MKDCTPDETVRLVVLALTEARKKQKLSHEKLAFAAGVTRPAVSLIESGKRQPSLMMCIKLASALKLNLSDVLAEVEKNK